VRDEYAAYDSVVDAKTFPGRIAPGKTDDPGLDQNQQETKKSASSVEPARTKRFV
jgi:hypothetical protein